MNGRLPVVRARDAIRALERTGFVVSRQSGSHCRLIHAANPARKVTVPVHKRRSQARHAAGHHRASGNDGG
jgi:predicted RNA binding protein YcfA (HicA-like mRNA interferase family)